MAGWFPLFRPGDILPQRSVINVGFMSPATAYRFINHIVDGEQWGPAGSNWFNGTALFNQVVGSNGYPSTSTTNTFGCGIRLPASSVYGDGTSEFYVLRWTGVGEAGFNLNTGTITLQAGSSTGYSVVSGQRWTGTNPYIVFRYTGPAQLFSLSVYSTDGTLANLEVYRLSDETDRNMGLIFRMPYKIMLKALCPGAIRFMDWHGGNASWGARWEYRTPPNNPCFGGGGGGYDWISSPKYGRTSGTNQYTLSSVTGTPVSMTHSEIATFQIASGMVRAGAIGISDISVGSNGRVTTNSPHGYSTGDVIVHSINARGVVGTMTSGSNIITSTSNTNIFAGMEVYHSYFPTGTVVSSSTATTITVSNNATSSGADSIQYQPMPKLHCQPCTVTVVDTTHYDTGVNTSSYGAFTGSSGDSNQYITLNIGNRGAYPVVFVNGSIPASNYGNGYMNAGDYKTVIFDKTICASKDSSGAWVFGVWIFNNGGQNNGHIGGVPVEICTALINEVNALSPAKPINMWLNIPHLAMQSADPDYSSNSNYGVKALDAVLNGTTVAGKTWAGLNAACNLYVEYSNETWNSGGDPFGQTFYLWRRGFHRWNNSTSDSASMVALRSSLIFDDMRQSNGSSRVKYIMGCQGTLANTGLNTSRMDGSYVYTRDSLVTGNPRLNGLAPLTYPHDHIAFASYIDANQNGTWDSVNLTPLATAWVGNIGNTAAQEANCASYVAGQIDLNTAVADAGPETIGQYLLKLADYSSKVATFGSTKRVIQYEGGWDHNVSVIGASGIGSPAQYMCSGTFVASSTTISNIPSVYVSALSVGDFIIGPNVPANSRVATKPTSTSITVTIAPTASSVYGEFIGMATEQAFLRAVKRSQAWSNAYRGWMDAFAGYSNCGMPSLYVIVEVRWGDIHPDAYGSLSSATEWTDLDLLFTDVGARNRALAS